MKVLLICGLLLASFPLIAGTPGSFRGTVVDGPEKSTTYVYVEGFNHSVRRVYVSGAKISYDSDVPVEERRDPVPKTLPTGTQIRVTAEQDDAGEWRAEEIEILKAEPPVKDNKKLSGATTSQS